MLNLRPYKPCDAETIVSWCKDEAAGFQENGEKFDIPFFGEMWTVIELEMKEDDYEALIHH